MLLVFDSLSGNVRRFVAAVQTQNAAAAFDLKRAVPSGEFLLLTYTFGRGEVPPSTAQFLQERAQDLRGVVASGSFHWGAQFARAGDRIAEEYRVPCVAKINKSGSAADRDAVVAWLRSAAGRSSGRDKHATLD